MTLFPAATSTRVWGAVPDLVESPWTVARLGVPALTFIVAGNPAPQGSKSFKGMRQSKRTQKLVPVLVESSAAKNVAWRDSVIASAHAATPPGWVRLAENNRDGVVLDVVFTRDRPAGLLKRRTCWPGASPDLDKLARSTGDALKSAGVYADDARVVGYRRLDKVFVGSGDPDALPHPGAVIRVWPLRGSVYDLGGSR